MTDGRVTPGWGWIWSFWGIRGRGPSPLDMRGYNTDRSATQRAKNMQIKRLLDDREVFVGDTVFDARGRPYAFLEH